MEIGERKVDLKNVKMPVLNIFAKEDHLVPPASSISLEQHVGSSDVTTLAFPGGHIGIYVGGRAQKELGPTIAKWIKARA